MPLISGPVQLDLCTGNGMFIREKALRKLGDFNSVLRLSMATLVRASCLEASAIEGQLLLLQVRKVWLIAGQ